MTVTPEMLMAFVDGELSPGERAEVEAAMAADAALAAEVERQRALRTRVASAYAGTLGEPAPDPLVALIKAGGPKRDAEVVDLAAARAGRVPKAMRGWLQWGALAACFLLGFMVAAPIQLGSSSLMQAQGRSLVARGPLAQTLDRRLAVDQPADAAIRVGLSFKDHDGDYCRTFTALDHGGVAGVACREGRRWRVVTAVFSNAERTKANRAAYQTAGSQTPAAVLAETETLMEGSALDAPAEAQARAAGWRNPSRPR